MTGNERRPTVARRYAATCSRRERVMKMSADDDDQAYQQQLYLVR